MAFDPDAYLAVAPPVTGGFDPDAYLAAAGAAPPVQTATLPPPPAHFDPNSYLRSAGRELSEDFVSQVKGYEGFNPRAFGDYKQTSVGYGTRAKAPGEKLSRQEADARLREELAMHARNVDEASGKLGYTFTPQQREALVSFDFNTGSSAELMRNAKGDLGDLQRRFAKYVKAGGKPLEGLRKRRASELEWFNGATGTTRESIAGQRETDAEQTLADRADKLATGLGKGIRGVVETGSNALSEVAADPLRAVQALPSTVLEGATRGTFDLVDMGRRIQNNDALQRARAIASPTALVDPTVRSAFANALLPPAQQTDLDFQRALENQAWEETRRAGVDEQGNMLPQGFRDALGAPLPATAEALSLVLDPTLALPGIGQGTKLANVGRRSLAAGVRPVATATEAAGSAVTSGMTRAGGALMQGIESTGIDPTIARAGAGVVGAGSLLTAPGQFIAGTGAAAQALGAVADTALSGRSQFSASARIAADPAKPMWLRKSASVISRLPDAPFAVAGAGFEGTLQGSALGGALALASGEDAEGIGEAIGTGGPLGAAGAGAGRFLPSNRRAQRQLAEDGDILWALSRQEEQGGAVDHLARLPRQELLKVATLQRVFADTTDVLFVPKAKFAELVPNAGAAGAYVHASPEGRPQILVNVDARQSTGRTLFHETSHALMRSPAINKDEARLAIAEAYPADRLDAMGLEYSRRQLEAERASLPPPLPAPPAPAVSPGLAAELSTPPPLPARDERIVTGALARQRFEQLTADAVAAGDLDGRDWIRDEVLAEHFAAELDGRPWNLDDIRRGAAPGTNLGRVREAWLEAKGRFLSALGVPFDQTGKLAKPLSEVFRDNPLTRDPVMQKLVIGQLRQRTNWLSALHRASEREDTLQGAPLVTAKGLQALANSPAIQWRPRPDGSAETDFAVRTRDGRVVIKGVDEIRETERLRTAQSRMIVPSQAVPAGSPQFGRKTVDGRQVIAGHTLPPQFDMLNHFGAEARVAARAMEAARANGGTFDLWYHQIGSGGDQAWSSAVRKGLGNVSATQRELSLVGWEQSKAGNIYGRLLDVGAARARAFELQNAGRLELWGGDVNGFQRDVQTYLANHAAGRDGHAGIGEGKRDFINGFFGVSTKANRAANPVWSGKFGRSLIKSFRLDRMQNVRPTSRQGWAVTYERMKANLLPDKPANFLDSARVKMQNEEDGSPAPQPLRAEAARDPEATLASALADTRASSRGLGPEQDPEGAVVRKTEALALYRWAGEHEMLNRVDLGKREDGGREHDVWIGGEGRIYKSTLPGSFGFTPGQRWVTEVDQNQVKAYAPMPASPAQYLERLRIANEVFGDDVRLESITIDDGSLRIVTSQKYITGKHPSKAQIKRFMEKRGFVRLGNSEYSWHHPEKGIAAFDAHEGNFKQTKDGQIHPVDLVLGPLPGAAPPAPRAPGSASAAGPGVEAIAADVSSMVKGWGSNPQIRVFQDLSEIPENQTRERAMGVKGKVEAFHRFVSDGKGGRRSQVTLIAGNISSVQRARELITHEVIGHASMQALFRGRFKDRYDGIIDGVWRKFGKSRFGDEWMNNQGYRTLRDLGARYGFSPETKEGRAQIIEEHLARMAESGKRPSWVQAVVAQIRELLRQVSPQLFKTYNESDILALLQQARARAKDGLGDGYN